MPRYGALSRVKKLAVNSGRKNALCSSGGKLTRSICYYTISFTSQKQRRRTYTVSAHCRKKRRPERLRDDSGLYGSFSIVSEIL